MLADKLKDKEIIVYRKNAGINQLYPHYPRTYGSKPYFDQKNAIKNAINL